jgi:hypothetical protein
MARKTKLKVGDLCRVLQSTGALGPTLFIVDYVGEEPYQNRCVIREAGNPLAGGQEFDLSCLAKVQRR